jgi:hypothetical protein
MRAGSMVAATVLAVACASPPQTVPQSHGVSVELGATLNVRVEGDSVRFELHVTNVTSDAIVLEFPTAQRYDFEVRTETGRVLWRWSDEMAHAQVVGHEVLAAGASERYVAVHGAAELAGGREAYGRLTSTSHPVELRTPVQLATASE